LTRRWTDPINRKKIVNKSQKKLSLPWLALQNRMTCGGRARA
jgi:hypothetical protein